MSVREYVDGANESTLLVVMIETAQAIANIDQILSVRGIDAIFVGPDDLSLNLGIFQQRDSPKFKAALKVILKACRDHGVAPGIHCNESNISQAIADGFCFVGLNNDDTFLQIGAKQSLGKVRGFSHDERN